MLPFKNRLTRKKDHEKVQKFGIFVSAKNIAIKIMENGTRDTRIGIVVGLKYSKKAIERNQVKKEIRGIIQPELKNIKKGLDIVIMARKREEEKTRSIDFKKNIMEVLALGQLLTNIKEDKSSIKTK
ncbi:MAG: ribonuclease P protein component [Candidatus Moranbacteria bacterium]|nr:ribonuclease P protein component [Candidatus Moranbacteria bacterium]MDZ4385447.1 ribonuclease P protein component [Candidatus Moranbacteria bacterium]